MANFRMEKVNSEIQKIVSNILNTELDNPIIDKIVISVVKVDTAPDFSQSKIFISILESDEKQLEIFSEIKKTAGFVRKRLAEELNLKRTPKLIYVYDEAIEDGSKILKLLDEMKKKGEIWLVQK